MQFVLGTGVWMMSGCVASTPPESMGEPTPLESWSNEGAEIFAMVPRSWSIGHKTKHRAHFYSKSAPGHVLSIQRLTATLGEKPLRVLKQSIKEHPYFSDFTYESIWSRRVDQVWAPSYHARYLYLKEAASRFGTVVPTANGYFEVSYHAPNGPTADGVEGFETLVESITLFSQH